jgi:hypothetical protein
MCRALSKLFKNALSVGSVLAILPFTQAVAGPILPDPFDPADVSTYYDTNGNGSFDLGIDVPYSLQFDDFYTYPIYLLDKYFPTAGWGGSSGTGTLDVIVTTRAAGQQNSSGDLAGFNIPDPVVNSNTSSIQDSWGNGGTPETTMLVDDLYNYLFSTFGASIPVFTFDQNETASNPDIQLTALVEILDAQGNVIADWSLDAVNNSLYDPTAYVTAAGQICVPDGITLTPNANDCFNNNVGSGSFDYVIFAPTMNLANYLNMGYIFKGSWDFQNVDNGGEEITLSGRFAPQTVPAPGTLLLLSLMLILSALIKGFRHNSLRSLVKLLKGRRTTFGNLYSPI